MYVCVLIHPSGAPRCIWICFSLFVCSLCHRGIGYVTLQWPPQYLEFCSLVVCSFSWFICPACYCLNGICERMVHHISTTAVCLPVYPWVICVIVFVQFLSLILLSQQPTSMFALTVWLQWCVCYMAMRLTATIIASDCQNSASRLKDITTPF